MARSKRTPWQVIIEDPCGQRRTIPLQFNDEFELQTFELGRGPGAGLTLRDAQAPLHAATIVCRKIAGDSAENTTEFWIQVAEGMDFVRVGDLEVRDARLPLGVPVRIGESRIWLETRYSDFSLPTQPRNIRHWLTCTEAGRETIWTIRKTADTPLAIYLAGETGTGKEVLAHLIHAWSDRASGPFVPLHCGALPLSLVESELFGHVKGAFTGAHQSRPGALMQAHGGTLFLDEVGDLPMDIQVKLLRFLENGEIRPVGSDRVSRADIRLVCATHLSLEQLVEEGRFRRDLFYRIASVTVRIPPLRERPADVEMLAKQFATELSRNLTPRALLRLKAHSWPGNVRELRHAVERASGMTGPFSPIIDESAFNFLMTPGNIARSPEMELGTSLSLAEMERVMILKALRLARGHRAHAARILGIARSTLFEMMKRHKIIGPRQAEAYLYRVGTLSR